MMIRYCLVFALAFAPSAVRACPASIFSGDFKPQFPKKSRQSLRLFKFERNQRTWQEEHLQVDFLDKDGLLVLPKMPPQNDESPDASKILQRGYGDNERITFAPDALGDRFQREIAPPCPSAKLYEVKSQTTPKRFGYLSFCDNLVSNTSSISSVYQFSPRKKTIATPAYRFQYNERNHILFEKIWAGSQPLAESSQLHIRSDVRNFFTLDFRNEDIESKINSFQANRSSFLANLTFYLHILFFKIDLRLNTTMSFFESSVHIPMILHLPVDARKWLHPASGTFYTWTMARKGFQLFSDEKELPRLNTDLVKKGYEALGELGESLCQNNICEFRLRAITEQTPFQMIYRIPKQLVHKGFFPMFTDQLDRDHRALGWGKAELPTPDAKPFGVYFDNSGLGEGEHGWNFWITMGDANAALKCPYPVTTGRTFYSKK